MKAEKLKVLYLTNDDNNAQVLDGAISEMNCEPVRARSIAEAKKRLQRKDFYATILSSSAAEEDGGMPKQNIGWDLLLELIDLGQSLRLGYLSCTNLEDQYAQIEQNCKRIHIGQKDLIQQGIQELLR